VPACERPTLVRGRGETAAAAGDERGSLVECRFASEPSVQSRALAERKRAACADSSVLVSTWRVILALGPPAPAADHG
jgi:hypothetical protein